MVLGFYQTIVSTGYNHSALGEKAGPTRSVWLLPLLKLNYYLDIRSVWLQPLRQLNHYQDIGSVWLQPLHQLNHYLDIGSVWLQPLLAVFIDWTDCPCGGNHYLIMQIVD
jgi:hypothetical protein